MIKVRYDDKRIRVTGHAGYAEAGKDIVCASVSALCCTLVQSIERIAEEKPKIQLKPGLFVLDLTDLSIISNVLVYDFIVGVEGIAKQYPNHVSVRRCD